MKTFFNNLSKAKQKANREATIAEMRKIGHRHFNMSSWCTLNADDHELYLDEVGFDVLSEPACGTTACLAGFATQVMPKTTWGRVRLLGCEDDIQRSIAQWLGVDESTFLWSFENVAYVVEVLNEGDLPLELDMRPSDWLSCWVHQNHPDVEFNTKDEVQKIEHEAIIAYLTALNNQ